ncbi:putative disease resistance protein [Trifolium repens]|nr:putative disease resistance protein [Trifolium repens]
MDAVISIATKIVELTIEPIGRQLGYIMHYKNNLESMKTEVQKLEGKKDTMQRKVNEARNNGEEIEIIVQNWLNKVDNTVVEAKKLIDTEGHAKAHCSMGHFPNMLTRHRLSRKTKKMSQEISQVLAEEIPDTISYPVPSEVTVTPFGRNYEALDSRTSMLNEIMMELKNPNNSIIGVYGMGGVGKTKLVEQLAYQAKNIDRLFSVVAMATITASPDLEKIQVQIADPLGMKFDKETKERRAMQLRKRISNEKSILIILDDIWGKFDLTEVGIPFGDDHKGCKLVVTSRYLNVLNSNMSIQKEFRLDVLNDEDSWKLFEKMAGVVVQDFNIKPIAEKVARRCVGFPLLIVTIATALRKKNIYDWQTKLNELERLDQEELHEKIHSTLKLSYNWLESEELKSFFSFIGSFGQGHLHTEDLFSCYWGLGLHRHSRSLTDARTRFYKLINDLKASSLLLDSETEIVKLHDVVREVAKSIASKSRPTYVEQMHTLVKQFPGMDQLQKCHQIIVPWSHIYKLPEKLDCPELELLELDNIGDYLKVPDDFFSAMGKLKVIVLCGMILTPSLPTSLCFLTKIQSLDMSECVLEDISIIAELKSLEILILERSDIKELPKEIAQLTNLRMLKLTNCCGLRFIPANLISSLTCLEELYMGNCFINWDVKGSKDQSNNASLDELEDLSHLTALDIMIQDASVLPMDLQVFAKLERYNIYVGDMWKWSENASETSRNLKLSDNRSSSILLDRGFNFLLNSTADMCLNNIQCVRNVFYELNMEGFPQLKHLCIKDSSDLKYIIDSMGLDYPYPVLPNLETLVLENLFNLEEICHGTLPIQSFSKLISFEAKGCDKLKNLLSYSHGRNLPELHKIKICDCKMITEIIAVQTSEADKDIDNIVFPKLGSLELEHLPNLISLCSMPLTADKCLKKCGENDDDKQCMPHVALFDQKVMMPHLELLKLSKINSRKLWDDNLSGCSFIQNLRSLTINECDNIVHAFSSSVVRELVNIKHLAISNCKMLEEIFVSDGKLGNLPLSQKPFSNDEVVFPNLETLEISHMEHLKHVDVFHCDKLVLFKPKSQNYQDIVPVDTLPLLSFEKVVRNTEELILSSKDVTMLCNGQLNDEHIYKVPDLWLRCFHDESDKFPSGFLQRFIKLKNLKVTSSSFTHIFSSGSECAGHSETTIKLRSLELTVLNNLESICDEKSELHPIIQNIETLVVESCSRLKNIVTSSVLFENLEQLQVYYCAGLEIIMKSSTATSLQKLKKLCIIGCEKIEEIIASDDESDTSEIAFMKLEHLHLSNLPRLRSFCMGTHGFKFPLLRELLVVDCPIMETFSHGVLNTPKLRKVHVNDEDGDEDEWHWNGDINSTIRKIVAKKDNQNSKDDSICPQNLNEGSCS